MARIGDVADKFLFWGVFFANGTAMTALFVEESKDTSGRRAPKLYELIQMLEKEARAVKAGYRTWR